ncbi:MAG: 2-oxo acid dehydrogenase subunit E2 [Thermoleophilia bacterium]|nr:2-oxo acid dehydrogenase subunit E2 [Thermoleophilia bacterium]
MHVEIVMPKWGLTMSEALIVQWLRAEGDVLAEGDPVVEVETEKADAEVTSPAAGVLEQIVAAPGAVIAVGQILAIVRTEGEAAERVVSVPLPLPLSEAPAASAAGERPESAPVAPQEGRGSEEGVQQASPLARRIARELGVALDTLRGSGPRGMIVEEDVREEGRAGSAGPPAPTAEAALRVESLSRIRRAIGKTMTRSLTESAQVTLTREAAVAGVREVIAASPEGVSLTDILVAATARTLLRHPRLNAHLVGDEFTLHAEVGIGLAVALEDGLVTPVIRRAHALSPSEIATERLRLVGLARGGRLRQGDLEGATFTLTNLGAYGIDAFTPILNPPEVGILGVGAVRQVPVVVDGKLAVGESCVLSLTFDHRGLDGAPAALFLSELASLLASPFRLGQALA